jgi:hypothetical protein
VGFTTSDDAFQREMKRLKVREPGGYINPNANATTHYLTGSNGDRTTIVCIEPPSKKRSKEQYAALVAHEATHVVQDMRERLGDLGHEAEAYLVQQIVQEGLQKAWKTNRVTRRKPRCG